MKYVGSKAKLTKEISPIIQKCIEDNGISYYYEPFMGGANMMSSIICKNRIGNDLDNLPIDLIEAGLNNQNQLFTSLPTPYPTKEHYYDVRDNPNNYEKGYRAAILLFGSYNARVYGGCYGAYANTKDGGVRNYFAEAKKNFEKQLPNLEGVELFNLDYMSFETIINKNYEISHTPSLIYCDPPYVNSIGYKSQFDSNVFWNWVRKISKKHYVIVSEYECPGDFMVPGCVWEKKVTTHMNNRDKIQKTEKLVTYKDGLFAKYYFNNQTINENIASTNFNNNDNKTNNNYVQLTFVFDEINKNINFL